MKQFMGPCLALILAIALSSCTAAPVSNHSRTPTPDNVGKEISEGTGGALIGISSDNVNAAGYDVSSKVMTVQFNGGAVYEYYEVPLNLWEDFLGAQPNPWSEVGNPRLVQGGFAYKRIG